VGIGSAGAEVFPEQRLRERIEGTGQRSVPRAHGPIAGPVSALTLPAGARKKKKRGRFGPGRRTEDVKTPATALAPVGRGVRLEGARRSSTPSDVCPRTKRAVVRFPSDAVQHSSQHGTVLAGNATLQML